MLRQKTRVWSVRELMKFAIGHLRRKGFAEARLNVELLLSHALGCQRIELYTNFDKPLTNMEMRAFRSLYERRLNREPVQYIVGRTAFMGLQFSVDPRVLIPRPETETLVEQTMLVCGRLPHGSSVEILEIGTGSGNIAVSLAKFVPDAHITAIDISDAALEVATQNAALHHVEANIVYQHMDVFEPVDQLIRRRFDVVVSNPPYVPPAEWDTLQQEIRKFEPRTALTDIEDGCGFLKRIVELAPYLVRDRGVILVEVGHEQADRVKDLMEQAEFFEIAVVPDLESVPRVVLGSCRSKTRNPGFVN